MSELGTPDPKREHDIDWAGARARIMQVLKSRLGPADASLDDLTQQASIHLLRVVRRDGALSLDGLISVIAGATAADEIRRRQREREGRLRWEVEIERLAEAPGPGDDPGHPDSELLWFLLVQFLRAHDPPGHALAVRYAELGGWRQVAESLGQGYDATRQQWSRSTRRFLDSLRRDPGPFKDWLDDV